MSQRLALKTPDGDSWIDRFDEGNGIVSMYGFRISIDSDNSVRVSDASTGLRYPRPDESDAMFDEIERLKIELARLKSQLPSTNGP